MKEQISNGGLQLAELTITLVRFHGTLWPLLPDALRSDVALMSMPDDAWIPTPGPAATWGQLRKLSWISAIDQHKAGSTRLGEVTVDNDLFGIAVHVSVRGRADWAITFHLDDDDREAASVLAARLRGLAETGGSVRDTENISLPLGQDTLTSLFTDHRQALLDSISEYHQKRAEIDALLEIALS